MRGVANRRKGLVQTLRSFASAEQSLACIHLTDEPSFKEYAVGAYQATVAKRSTRKSTKVRTAGGRFLREG